MVSILKYAVSNGRLHIDKGQRQSLAKSQRALSFWLFGISRGQGAGLPNLLGVMGKEPET